MPPKSPEQLSNYETPDSTPEDMRQYMQVERGDIHQVPAQSTNDNQNTQNSSGFVQQPNPQPTNQSVQQKTLDPVDVVKSMISTGFTPTQMQISSANNNSSGPQDSSNTWFALFLQRLLKQRKTKNLKNRR
jgi:hypothetical protein